MNKILFNLILLFTLSSCLESQDQEILNSSSVETSTIIEDQILTPEEAINIIAGSDSRAWKVETMNLTNSYVQNLEISQLTNIQDDSFIFSTNGFNSLHLVWSKRLLCNFNAQDLENMVSDEIDKQSTFNLEIVDPETIIFENVDKNITIAYVEGKIRGSIELDSNIILNFTLVNRNSNSFSNPPLNMQTVTALYEFNSDNSEVGFKYSHANNGLYLFNKLSNTTENQLALYINLENSQITERFFVLEDFEDKEIELINNQVYSIGGKTVQIFNQELIGDFTTITMEEEYWVEDLGSTVVDNELFFLTGDYVEVDKDTAINKFSLEDSTFETLEYTGHRRRDADGEVIDGNIYIFGGVRDSSFTPLFGNSGIFTYTPETGFFQTISALPFSLTYTHTGSYNDYIYVGGKRPINDIQPIELINFIGVFDVIDNIYYPITLNLGMFEDHDIIHLQVKNDTLFLVMSKPNENTNDYQISILTLELQ